MMGEEYCTNCKRTYRDYWQNGHGIGIKTKTDNIIEGYLYVMSKMQY